MKENMPATYGEYVDRGKLQPTSKPSETHCTNVG
jgi:hypothetical protein